MENSFSLVWQITVVFVVCISIVFLSGKFAIEALTRKAEVLPKRKAPWGMDCALILFLLYAILFPSLSLKITSFVTPDLRLDAFSTAQVNSDLIKSDVSSENSKNVANDFSQENDKTEKQSISTQHPMARLLIRSYGSPQFTLVVFAFFLTVVCVAPLTEEFIFRVVVQSAFEKTILPNRNQEDSDRNLYVPSKRKTALAIGVPAILFAALHAGTAESTTEPVSCDLLFQTTVSSLFSNTITLVVGLALLRRFFDAVPDDLGLNDFTSIKLHDVLTTLRNAFKEFYRGVVLYLIAAPVILGVNLLTQKLFPDMVVAPVPIFLFALWIGFIYYKTRRYVVCIGTHMALNFTSFIILLLNVRADAFGLPS